MDRLTGPALLAAVHGRMVRNYDHAKSSPGAFRAAKRDVMALRWEIERMLAAEANGRMRAVADARAVVEQNANEGSHDVEE